MYCTTLPRLSVDAIGSVAEISAIGSEGKKDIYTHGKNISGCIKDPDYKVEPLNDKMNWNYEDYNLHCHKMAVNTKDIYIGGMGIDCYSDIDYNVAMLICNTDSIYREKWVTTYPNEMIDVGWDASGYPFKLR